MPRRPTAFHGVAATACAACFFPDHRLSNSGCRRARNRRCGSLDSLRSLGMTHCPVIPSAVEGSALCPHWMLKRERPTWLMAQVGRVEPLRSGDEGDALWRVPSEPGPCTSLSCLERSVPEPARPAERHVHPRVLSVAALAHSRPARDAVGVGRPRRTRPHRADERARASGEPVVAGVPRAFAVELGERGHGIVSTCESVSSCSRDSRNEKSRRR